MDFSYSTGRKTKHYNYLGDQPAWSSAVEDVHTQNSEFPFPSRHHIETLARKHTEKCSWNTLWNRETCKQTKSVPRSKLEWDTILHESSWISAHPVHRSTNSFCPGLCVQGCRTVDSLRRQRSRLPLERSRQTGLLPITEDSDLLSVGFLSCDTDPPRGQHLHGPLWVTPEELEGWGQPVQTGGSWCTKT